MLAVSLSAMLLSLAAIAVRIAAPSSGTVVDPAGFAAAAVTVDVHPGAETPLRTGDIVTAIAGRPIGSWAEGLANPGSDPLTVGPGSNVTFDIVRDGRPETLDVPVKPLPAFEVLLPAWGTLSFVVALFVIAAFVFWRRPTVPAAGALLLTSIGGLGSTVPYLLGQDPLGLATGSFTASWVVTAFVYLLLWGGLIDFILVFPRPLGRVARRPAWRAAPYAAVLGAYVAALVAAWFGSPTFLAWLGASGALTLLPLIMAFAAIPVLGWIRWRRGPREDRVVLREYLAVMALIIVTDLVVWVGPEALTGRPLLPTTVSGLTGLPFPLVIAASILRYRAFDLNVVVRRSLVYGGLTVSVIAIYAISAAFLGALLTGSSPFATSLLATGAAAIAALPIRDGLQRATNRFLYGDRDEPVRAIRRLGERLELSVDPDSMPRVVVDTVGDALRLPYVGLELGLPPAARLVAERGERPDPERVIERPLTFHARPIGRLIVAARSPADPLDTSDVRLLDDLTRQVGVAAHAALLTEDLRASRERIVTAREEERRRLRRDLHDGVGPSLAAIGMRAEAAEGLIASDPRRAGLLLAELQAEVAAAIGEIRRVVDGLRPPAIDDVGLVGALRLAAERLQAPGAPDVSIESVGPIPELPAAVEVAAYRIGSEAMTNAVRHAGAGRCSVRLVGEDGELTVIVEDDGEGLRAARSDGIGLASMHERAAELGGECRIEPRAGGGTRIVARLPIVPDALGANA